jgi:hypothetical protein
MICSIDMGMQHEDTAGKFNNDMQLGNTECSKRNVAETKWTFNKTYSMDMQMYISTACSIDTQH